MAATFERLFAWLHLIVFRMYWWSLYCETLCKQVYSSISALQIMISRRSNSNMKWIIDAAGASNLLLSDRLWRRFSFFEVSGHEICWLFGGCVNSENNSALCSIQDLSFYLLSKYLGSTHIFGNFLCGLFDICVSFFLFNISLSNTEHDAQRMLIVAKRALRPLCLLRPSSLYEVRFKSEYECKGYAFSHNKSYQPFWYLFIVLGQVQIP